MDVDVDVDMDVQVDLFGWLVVRGAFFLLLDALPFMYVA